MPSRGQSGEQGGRTRPPEVRREQILEAATEVLRERGLRATTVADVADRAGVAKGTLYLYFESKEQLIGALQARYQQTIVEQAGVLRSGEGTLMQRLERFLGTSFDYHRANLDVHHILFHEAGMREDESMQALQAEVVAALREAGERGEVAVDDPDATARFLLYGLHGLLLSTLHAAHPSRKRFLQEATALCLRLVAAPASRPARAGAPAGSRRVRLADADRHVR